MRDDSYKTATTYTVSGSDGLNYTTYGSIYNDGNSFKFPYTAASSLDTIKDVVDTSRGIYVTKISNYNPYYFKGDYSGAITINNGALLLEKGGTSEYKKTKYNAVKKLKTTTTLANCVGWVHGRINEIWGTAVSTGYIKKVNGSWVIPSKNNYVITCGREPSKSITPKCDAYKFYANWPSSDGWYKTNQYEDNIRPLPGAVICWRNMTNSKGLCGHVAVVEAVYNWGTDDEYIVISQSGYSLTGAEKIAWTQVIRRDNTINGAPYGFSKNYKFAGFLFSPVCELLPENSYYATTHQTYSQYTEEEAIEVIKAEQSVYANISAALANKTTLADVVIGQKVKIVWFGSTTQEETNSKLNLMGGEGVVISVDKSLEYPYAVSLTGDNVISGYFNRGALKVIEE